MSRRALLVIDMLYDYLDRWAEGPRTRLLANVNALITAFRETDAPVIWVRQEFRADLSDAFLEMRDKAISVTIEGTRGAQIHADLDRRDSDPVIVKKRYSAFFRTDLDARLADLGVTALVLCGVNTHACIRMAAIDAYQRDMRVTIATDGVDSLDAEHARVSLAYMADKIATLATTREIVATARKGASPGN